MNNLFPGHLLERHDGLMVNTLHFCIGALAVITVACIGAMEWFL